MFKKIIVIFSKCLHIYLLSLKNINLYIDPPRRDEFLKIHLSPKICFNKKIFHHLKDKHDPYLNKILKLWRHALNPPS